MDAKKLIGRLKAVIAEPYLTSTSRVEYINEIIAEAEQEIANETTPDVSKHTKP